MNRRIFRSMCLLILFIVTALFLLGLAFSGQLERELGVSLASLRATVIDGSGRVLFDNRADSSGLGNHIDRPEVRDALRSGAGDSERLSDTLGEKTYYHAVRMNDGSVLRLSLTTDSAYTLLRRFVPVVALCLLLAALLAFFLGKRLTRRIIAPLGNIDFDSGDTVVYEELLPFFRKIQAQKGEISGQLAELEGRERTIRAITENMREGLLLLDERGCVLLANQSVGELLSVTDIQGRDIVRVCREAGFMEGVKRSLSGERMETTFQKDGRTYGVFCTPLVQGGAVVLLMDMTERHAAEKQRKEFSANVSHELKTPLTTISALAEMMADGTARREDTRRFGEKIQAQSRRLIGMIDDIIRLSTFDEGNVERIFSRFDLHELACSVIKDLQERAISKNITIELVGDESVAICANRNMMYELLYNLVDNAIKYNRDEGAVLIRLSREGEICKIGVEDTGIGIPATHLARVFERFYRVDASRSKKTGGTGLGLSIVRHIVEHHGGKIDLASEENVGTRILCVLKDMGLYI